MEQRTAEWFDARKGRVTGSNWGAVLGLNPWRKPEEVLRAMVREAHGAEREFTGNPATQYGQQYERAATKWFERETGITVEECGFFKIQDWGGASPDGLTSDDGVIEIKVPFKFRNTLDPEFQSIDEMPWYYAQVQAEMLAAEKDKAYFVQYAPEFGDPFSETYRPEQGLIEPVYLDAEWCGRHICNLICFHDRYLDELHNPEHLEPLRRVIDDQDAINKVVRIKQIDAEMKDLKEERKTHMDRLVDAAMGQDAEIAGHKLTKVERKGNVDYGKVIKDNLPDLDVEQYRKKASISWRLS